MKKIIITLLISALLLPAVSFAATFNQNLSYGSSGPAVTDLQNFLTAHGLYTGPITGGFFNLTKGAVIAFQKQNNIQPASGFVGPLTRAKVNLMLSEQTSGQQTVSSAASASPVASADTPALFTVAQNSDTTLSSETKPTIAAGALDQFVGSYSITASANEGVTILSVSIAPQGNAWANLNITINGVPFGSTQAVVSPGATYTFSKNPYEILAGETINVNVFADALSSAVGTLAPATILTGVSGTGLSSNNTLSLSTPINGQTISFSGEAIVTPPPNSTLCNGTYWNNCSAGGVFACLSTGGTCHAPNAGFCNNQYWGACPSGEAWSCAPTGGVCSAPPQAVTQPIITPQPVVAVVPPPTPSSPVPTPAQFCQQLHDQELASTTQSGEAMVQQATNNYDQVYAYEEAQLNSFGASGMGMSGLANLAQQDINKAQAEVASATAQYQTQLANVETVQTCLSALTPTN
jgi:hypothetical protein